jgi:NTP pyrophosphatase (non-canonical NTP hydrolase)
MTTEVQISKMPYDHELLTVLMEEAAEVIQEASKCIRFGVHDNMAHLEKEIGDFMCMIELLHQHDHISFTRIERFVEQKRNKLKKYSNLIIESEE